MGRHRKVGRPKGCHTKWGKGKYSKIIRKKYKGITYTYCRFKKHVQ